MPDEHHDQDQHRKPGEAGRLWSQPTPRPTADATPVHQALSQSHLTDTPSPTQPAATNAMIRLVGVHKSFGAHKVLQGVDLEVPAGKTTVIVGPSGTGKSVLLKLIVGLLKPDRGEVWFRDKRINQLDPAELVEARKQIGFLFQMGALFDSMNVRDNVCFPLVEHTKLTAAERRRLCRRVLRMVGLVGVGSKMPAELSGGQRKRVALARAIVLEPRVVLYDEPTTGLDPIRSDVINELIVTLAQRLSITSVVVTHDMASANKIADRMVMLYDGRIVANDEPEAFRGSDNDLVQRFIHGRADREDLERIRTGFDRVQAGENTAGSPTG